MTAALRDRIREAILTVVEGERAETLAAQRSARTPGRRGYRNGSEVRTITTGLGAATVDLPRGRLWQGDHEVEWRSRLVPRSERRVRAWMPRCREPV